MYGSGSNKGKIIGVLLGILFFVEIVALFYLVVYLLEGGPYGEPLFYMSQEMTISTPTPTPLPVINFGY